MCDVVCSDLFACKLVGLVKRFAYMLLASFVSLLESSSLLREEQRVALKALLNGKDVLTLPPASVRV